MKLRPLPPSAARAPLPHALRPARRHRGRLGDADELEDTLDGSDSNLSPAQLEQLDRALTPAELARVDAWHAQQEKDFEQSFSDDAQRGLPHVTSVTATRGGVKTTADQGIGRVLLGVFGAGAAYAIYKRAARGR